jgi:integrase
MGTRKAQLEQRLALGLGIAPPDGLVFVTWKGKPRHPDGLTKEWKDAMEAIGRLKITLHSLRHTHASQLIAAGLDVLTISRRLGHGSPAITLGVYGHLFANTDARAVQVMEAALAAMRTK